MAKVDKVENKEAVVEKKVDKKSKKSSYSKKKKIKKNILNGIAYVQSTFNNTIISIADTNGNVISWASAGQKGFKGSRKSTPYAAQIAADSVKIFPSIFNTGTLPAGLRRRKSASCSQYRSSTSCTSILFSAKLRRTLRQNGDNGT